MPHHDDEYLAWEQADFSEYSDAERAFEGLLERLSQVNLNRRVRRCKGYRQEIYVSYNNAEDAVSSLYGDVSGPDGDTHVGFD